MMTRIQAEELMAHLDGELPGVHDGRVARALAEDEALRAEAEAQRRLKEKLARRYDAVLDEPVPERFRAMLDTNMVPLAARVRTGRRLGWPHIAAIAASLAVLIVAAQMTSDRTGHADAPRLAGGALAAALDAQLASTQASDAPVRIGVSFAARDGRLCRTFEKDVTAGLACHVGDGWQVIASAAASRSGGEYRQAGTGSVPIMEKAEKMMAGRPLDARGEREARARGWVR